MKTFETSHKWEAKSITSLYDLDVTDFFCFDILTFILLYFVIVPMTTGQAYVRRQESQQALSSISRQVGSLNLWSQTMVIHICFVQQNSLLTKPSVMVGSWDNLASSQFCDLLPILQLLACFI